MKERILAVVVLLLFIEGYLLGSVFPSILASILLFYLTFIRIEFRPRVSATRFIENQLEEGKRQYCEVKIENEDNKGYKVAIIENLPPGFEFEVPVVEIYGGESKSVKYWILPKRGKYKLKGPTLKIVDLREVYCDEFNIGPEVEVEVYPSIERIKEDAAAEKNLRLAATFKKFGKETLELESLRKYQPGDDVRRIEWKATARLGELIVKVFLKEAEEEVYIVLDAGREMRKGIRNSKIDYATTLVLQLAHALRDYKVGLIVYDDYGVLHKIEPTKDPIERFRKVLDIPPLHTGLIAVKVPEISYRLTISDFVKRVVPLIKGRKSFSTGLLEATANIKSEAYMIFIADITSHTSELVRVLSELKDTHKIVLLTPNPVLFYDASKLDKEKILWLYRRYIEREKKIRMLNKIVPTVDVGPADLISFVRDVL